MSFVYISLYSVRICLLILQTTMEGNKDINYTSLLRKLMAESPKGALEEPKIKKNIQEHYCHIKMF